MKDSPQNITIKQAAELLGVTPTTLRNWDKSGKLVADRDPQNGYRVYSIDKISTLLQERSGVAYTVGPTRVEAEQLALFKSERDTSKTDIKDARSLRFLVRQMSQAFRDSLGGGLLERIVRHISPSTPETLLC